LGSLGEALTDFKAKSPEADMGLIWIGKTRFHSTTFKPVSATIREGRISTNLSLEGPHGALSERVLVEVVRIMMALGWKKIWDEFYEKWIEGDWTQPDMKLRNEHKNVPVNVINKPRTGIFYPHKFWLVEYFVKEEHLEELVALCRIEFQNLFVYNATIRHVRKYEETSTPYARTDVFSLVVCWDQVLTPEQIDVSTSRNGRFLDFLKPRGGTFYLAYKNTPEDAEEFYPEFAELVKERGDSSLFSNLMIEKIRSLVP